jgi:hypothetical protein
MTRSESTVIGRAGLVGPRRPQKGFPKATVAVASLGNPRSRASRIGWQGSTTSWEPLTSVAGGLGAAVDRGFRAIS